MNALGNKHVGPNIGLVQMNNTELLHQVYTRGTWNRTPDHHVVFTYQAVPRQGGGRKRMKYSMDGSGPGCTAFNVWPAPVNAISTMSKTSAQVHDISFANDVPRTLAQRMDQALLSCKTWLLIPSDFPASSTISSHER